MRTATGSHEQRHVEECASCPDRGEPVRMITIGEAAEASGVSSKMIRYYERIGLMPSAPRRGSGYRLYGPEDVQVLRFVGRARELGFPVRAIAELLALRRKIAELEGMAAALDHLVADCAGDGRPDCPILDDLADARGTGGLDASADDPTRL